MKENEKLLKRITVAMEGYGMPKHDDKYPAMDILKIIDVDVTKEVSENIGQFKN